jgi:hypothetical protein
VLHLLQDFETVSVIARRKEGFEDLHKTAGKNRGKINTLRVDYNNYSELTSTLAKAIKDNGGVSLVISWVHSTAPLASVLSAKIINETSPGCDFFELLGSIYADPKAENNRREISFEGFENINYRKIILGFIADSKSSRWLNNDEITKGVIDSTNGKLPEYIVGTVEPWDRRP